MLGSLGVCVCVGAQLQGSARHPSAGQTVWTSDVVSTEHTDGRSHGRSQPPVETPVQVSSATEAKVASAFFCSRSWHIRVWDLKSLGLVSDALPEGLILPASRSQTGYTKEHSLHSAEFRPDSGEHTSSYSAAFQVLLVLRQLITRRRAEVESVFCFVF